MADDLSALADVDPARHDALVLDKAGNRHRDDPQLAIIGYGKLGGKGARLWQRSDIVFVYDDPQDGAPRPTGRLCGA